MTEIIRLSGQEEGIMWLLLQAIGRWTTRGLIVTVVIVALILGLGIVLELELKERGRRLKESADAHYLKTINGRFSEVGGWIIARGPKQAVALEKWHQEMGAKYDRAASRPWLRVAPDPPAPK